MTFYLQSYLLEHKSLPLPGLGTLSANNMPARYDVSDRSFTVPDCQVLLLPLAENDQAPIQPLVGYLAQKLDLGEEEAFEQYQQYLHLIKTSIAENGKFDWSPVGYFTTAGEGINFTPHFAEPAFHTLQAERIVRAGVAHQMTVGDKETTSTAMEEYLTETPAEINRWWILPLVIGGAALLLIILKKMGILAAGPLL